MNSQNIGIAISALTVLATSVYVFFTRQLLRETIKLRKVSTDPCISVYIEPQEKWIKFLDIVIRNIGHGPAYDIKFNIEPDVKFLFCEKRYFSDLPFMRKIEYFAPNQQIKTYIGSSVDLFNDKDLVPFIITALYKSKDGQEFKEVFNIDLKSLEGMACVGTPPLYEMASTLKEISDNLKRMK